MKSLITSIALVASLAFVASANAQQTRALIIQQPTVQPYVNPAPDDHFDCARLGFHGHYIHGRGMKIFSVLPHSKAAELGLEAGDIIKSINGTLVTSEWQYRNLLLNAINYDHGHVDLVVRNVRYDWGYHVPKFVTIHTFLKCHDHVYDHHDH